MHLKLLIVYSVKLKVHGLAVLTTSYRF